MVNDKNTSAILNIAKWAIKRARTMVPYSGNLPDPQRFLSHRALFLELVRRKSKNHKAIVNELFRWNLDLSSDKERYRLNGSAFYFSQLKKFIPFRDLIKLVLYLPISQGSNSLEWVEKSSVKALKFGIGNCEELSAFSMLLLLELEDEEMLSQLDGKILVERISFVLETDHCFLILNRKTGKLSDLLSWNLDAVICDAWNNETYTLQELLENKTEEERKFILDLFQKEAMAIAPMALGNFYIGKKNNERIHSDQWFQKINDKKYWRPRNLIDLQDRIAFTKPESLPESRLLPSKLQNNKYNMAQLSQIQYKRMPINPSMLRFAPTHQAIMLGNREKLREIIETSPHFLQNQIDNKTPIVTAADNGQWDLVSIIADYPTNLIDQAQYGQALLTAIRFHEIPLAFKLIKAGASTDWQCPRRNGGNTVFHYAVVKNNKELLSALLKARNKPIFLKNAENHTPIEKAAAMKRFDLVSCFADYPTDEHDYSGYGTALWAAYSMQQNDLMVKLLKAGAPTLMKRNALIDYTIKNNYAELMEILLERGFCDEDFLDHLQCIEDLNHLDLALLFGKYYLNLYKNLDQLGVENEKKLGEMYWGLLGLYSHFSSLNNDAEELLILKEVSSKNPSSKSSNVGKTFNNYYPGFFFSASQFQYDSQVKFERCDSPEFSSY